MVAAGRSARRRKDFGPRPSGVGIIRPMEPLERLVNLLILLLNSRRALTFDEIQEAMGTYRHADRGSAKRQFERDKDILRAAGIPVEVEPVDGWGTDQGYRVPRERYELPEVSFTPDEVAALFVAAHAPGEDGEAARAFGKLAHGTDSGVLAGLEEAETAPGVDASAPHLQAAADAVSRRRLIRFGYRPVQGESGERLVDAWGLVYSRGSWYVVGRDRSRGDVRTFKLSRISSEILDQGEAEPPPAGFSARERFAAGPWGAGEPKVTARIAFSPKVAPWALAQTPDADSLRTRRDGWVEARIHATRTDALVSWILSFGPDAVVKSPKALREAVVERLEAVRASL